MCGVALLLLASAAFAGVGFAAAPPEAVVQGFYEGVCTGQKGENKLECRVVALGQAAYHVFVRHPLGDGKVAKFELEGKTEGDFQDHGNPMEYRNIWVLPLADP
jgi:hypothetical protein